MTSMNVSSHNRMFCVSVMGTSFGVEELLHVVEEDLRVEVAEGLDPRRSFR